MQRPPSGPLHVRPTSIAYLVPIRPLMSPLMNGQVRLTGLPTRPPPVPALSNPMAIRQTQPEHFRFPGCDWLVRQLGGAVGCRAGNAGASMSLVQHTHEKHKAQQEATTGTNRSRNGLAKSSTTELSWSASRGILNLCGWVGGLSPYLCPPGDCEYKAGDEKYEGGRE